jgi:HTH-type transcriptional regulator/antitoxin HigA
VRREPKLTRSKADDDAALAEAERLWGAKSETPSGDRLVVLAPSIDAYQGEHCPTDPADPAEAIKFRMEQQDLTRNDLEASIGTRTQVACSTRKRRAVDR